MQLHDYIILLATIVVIIIGVTIHKKNKNQRNELKNIYDLVEIKLSKPLGILGYGLENIRSTRYVNRIIIINLVYIIIIISYLTALIYDLFIGYHFFLSIYLAVICIVSLSHFTYLRYSNEFYSFVFLVILIHLFFINKSYLKDAYSAFYNITLILMVMTFYFVFIKAKDKIFVLFNILCVIIAYFIVFKLDIKVELRDLSYEREHFLTIRRFIVGGSMVFAFFYVVRYIKFDGNYVVKQNEIIQPEPNITLNQLVELAKGNDQTLFINHFNSCYPDFFKNLLEINPNLTTTELKICAYIKLSFSTKEIADYNNNSVRTVEKHKYNLRKKLNLSSQVDLYLWHQGL